MFGFPSYLFLVQQMFRFLRNASYVLFVAMFAAASFAHSQTINTVVGGGPAPGTPALQAAIGLPIGVASDSLGNVYIASSPYGPHSSQARVFEITPAGTISVFAGSGVAGHFGDGGPATSAGFQAISGIAVDAAGNVYIADAGACVVRKVTPAGTITTIAGTGVSGYTGDGGPATSATLNNPDGVAVDSSGNFYISDQIDGVVRKVTATGKISTYVGTGTSGYSGDGGPATSAQLKRPSGLTVDSVGNLYIADSANYVVRKVSAAGIISTVAGMANGIGGYSGDGGPATSALLGSIQGVAVDNAGNLYISDWFFNVVRQVTSAGIIYTVVGNGTAGYSGDGGSATNAEISSPQGLTVDPTGDLYIADQNNLVVRKVTTSGAISTISTVAGNRTVQYSGDGGPATGAELNQPSDVTIDSAGNLYIADQYNNVIRKVTPAGIISTVAGNGAQGYSGDGGSALDAMLNHPAAVAVDHSGNLFIADQGNYVVRLVNLAGTISTVAGNGTQGNSGDGGPATSAQFSTLTGVAADGAGNFYISDFASHVVRKVTSGTINAFAGNGIEGYSGDGGLATSAELNAPYELALDSANNLYIADFGGVVRKVAPLGAISTVAGNGTGTFCETGDGGLAINAHLEEPTGLAVDSAGNIYIVGYDDPDVRMVSTEGVINTIAGTCFRGFSGDGGPALNAQLNFPLGAAVDGSGTVYIADWFNHRIRALKVPALSLGSGSLAFGNQAVGQLSAPQTITVSNNSALPVSISSISITGLNSGDFSQTNTCGSGLAGNGSCDIFVTFTPLAAGNLVATLSISDSGSGTPQTVSLSGTGVYPQALPSPASFSFGNQALGQPSVSQSVTLSNPAVVPLTITGISISGLNPGDFSQTNNCGSSVPAGGSCVVQVTFTPTVLGARSAILGFSDNASNAPQTVALDGVGTPFGMVPALSMLSIASPGASAHDTLTITPGTGFHGVVHLTCEVAFAGQGTAHDLPKCEVEPEDVGLHGSANVTGGATVGDPHPHAASHEWNDDHDRDDRHRQGTTPGNYTVTVKGRHHGRSVSAVIQLTVQ